MLKLWEDRWTLLLVIILALKNSKSRRPFMVMPQVLLLEQIREKVCRLVCHHHSFRMWPRVTSFPKCSQSQQTSQITSAIAYTVTRAAAILLKRAEVRSLTSLHQARRQLFIKPLLELLSIGLQVTKICWLAPCRSNLPSDTELLV